ncbi:hypothetical protein HK27_02710 [Acetobacter orientalis]|nr:hypothetical protein HK27_02710 [Acetobacter orientalis]
MRKNLATKPDFLRFWRQSGVLKGTLPAPTPKHQKCALTYSGTFAKHDNALLTICRHTAPTHSPHSP